MLNWSTVPNVILNLTTYETSESPKPTESHIMEEIKNRASFYYGDWQDLDKLLLRKTSYVAHPQKFDFILTCETIYNPECHSKLLDTITNCLSDSGIVYPFIITNFKEKTAFNDR